MTYFSRIWGAGLVSSKRDSWFYFYYTSISGEAFMEFVLDYSTKTIPRWQSYSPIFTNVFSPISLKDILNFYE